jgi:hypothetical protein
MYSSSLFDVTAVEAGLFTVRLFENNVSDLNRHINVNLCLPPFDVVNQALGLSFLICAPFCYHDTQKVFQNPNHLNNSTEKSPSSEAGQEIPNISWDSKLYATLYWLLILVWFLVRSSSEWPR